MTIYSVFEPIEDRRAAAAPKVVADKFSWLALLLPPVFLAVHRLWRALLGFGVAVVALWALQLGLGTGAAFWLYVLLALWLGFEAPALRRAGLKRRGFAYQTDVVAGAPDAAAVEWLRMRMPA